jgi:asparagine synthase (glutamine-hydrolysing)
VSDVPIGAFLSGGIDSSSVVAMLQKKSSEQIKTFNVKFEQLDYDESRIARKVAEYCGTDHHEICIPNVSFTEDIFWTIIDHVGMPFRDSSAIPTYLVSQAISKEVKVALSGDGGDELFGGYDLFQWYQKITAMRKLPSFLRSFSEGGVNLMQKLPGTEVANKMRKIKRGIRTSLLEEKEIPVALNEFFTNDQCSELFAQNNKPLFSGEEVYGLYYNYPSNYKEWTPLRKIMYYRLIHTLPANMLVKVDRMSMASSLEVRAPFLDVDLFKSSTMLSDDLLLRKSKGKYILREMMKEDLPEEVFDHPKKGFNLPLYAYQNTDYKALAYKLLFEENPWKEMFVESELQRIYDEGINNSSDNATTTVFQTSHKLWMLMQLLGWASRFRIQS